MQSVLTLSRRTCKPSWEKPIRKEMKLLSFIIMQMTECSSSPTTSKQSSLTRDIILTNPWFKKVNLWEMMKLNHHKKQGRQIMINLSCLRPILKTLIFFTSSTMKLSRWLFPWNTESKISTHLLHKRLRKSNSDRESLTCAPKK